MEFNYLIAQNGFLVLTEPKIGKYLADSCPEMSETDALEWLRQAYGGIKIPIGETKNISYLLENTGFEVIYNNIDYSRYVAKKK